METEKILLAIESLAAQIKELKCKKSDSNNVKEDRKELFMALAKAQSEMKIAGCNSENPYFKSKYADLADIVRASRPALTKNGLCVIQQILISDDGASVLHTVLAHASGQSIDSTMRILPIKNDIQSFASYMTYCRRYSYASICGVVVGDEDDERQLVAKGTALNTKYNPKEESIEVVTKEQLDEINYELAEYPDIAEQVLEGLKLQNLANMPKSKYSISMRRIREIKNARNGIK